MYFYALFREGVYRHECGGIFTDLDQARDAIKILRAKEPDNYHTWECVPFEPNKITPVYHNEEIYTYSVDEPDSIDI